MAHATEKTIASRWRKPARVTLAGVMALIMLTALTP
jgi:hypothetical protein